MLAQQHNITEIANALVQNISLEKLRHKLTQTNNPKMQPKEFDLAEQEYRRFLALKKIYPQKELVPNKLVDELWHAHILDTASYQKDCQNVFGYFLHHFPYFGIYGDDDQQNLVNAFQKTKEIYERHFGEYPKALEAEARCEGHKCHVPTECACRGGPENCKTYQYSTPAPKGRALVAT